MRELLFTSESVTEGHPDKIADNISDAILDAMLTEDPNSRVACETLVTTGMVVVAGEVRTTAQVDFQKVVRQTIKEIGYTNSAMGFDCDTCAVLIALDQQSADIAQGVDENDGKEQGGPSFTHHIHQAPPVGGGKGVSVKLKGLCLRIRKNSQIPYLD